MLKLGYDQQVLRAAPYVDFRPCTTRTGRVATTLTQFNEYKALFVVYGHTW